MNCDFAGIDYNLGAQLAIKHLIKKGHEKIAFIGGRSESSTWKQRMEGYRTALQDFGIEIDESLIIPSAPTKDGGKEAVSKVLNLPAINRPTAIFCFSDLVAFGVTVGLRNAGLTPGKDMDLVGFDNIPESEILYPPLTTISSFANLLGEEAAKLLHRRLTDNSMKQKKVIIKPELIVRG